MGPATRAGGAIAAACLLTVAACSSSDGDTTSATSPTDAPVTVVEATDPPETTPSTEAPATDPPATDPPATDPPTTDEPEPDEPPATASPADLPVLDFESQPVPAGQYRVESLGAPFVIDIPEGWFVQPNSNGFFVITDPSSTGPGDRDLVMMRVSNLADPTAPGAPAEDQAGDWPLDDITGWINALVPGVVDGDPVETTVGGLDAVQFDAAITDEVECGPEFCVGFAINRDVSGLAFNPGVGHRVFWIDGGDESPIAIDIGDGGDPEFTERAQAVLDTVVFESVGPNPVPSEGNLWELGIPSEVPAGIVNLPIGPGVTFEMSQPHFIGQDEYGAGVLLDSPGEADLFFPNEAFDGESVATVDDVVGALERDPDITATVVGTRMVSGYEATQIDFSSSAEFGPDGPPPPTLRNSDTPQGDGWRAPPDGTLWIMETPDGLAGITAEWFEPVSMEPALALATEILDSITVGG